MTNNQKPSGEARKADLTPRQREVLQRLADGRTNGQIAEDLGISLEGAKYHVSELLSKLDVRSREEAADYWRRRNGLRPRLWRSFGALPNWLRWAPVALAGIALAAGAVMLIVLMHGSGSDSSIMALPATPDAQATPSVTTARPSVVTATVATTRAPVVAPIRRLLGSIDELPEGSFGVLFLDPATGDGEFWDLSLGGSFVASPSRTFRYIVYGSISPLAAEPNHLLDTKTGVDRTIGAIWPISMSPDESTFVGWDNGTVLGLYDTETLRPLLILGSPPATWPHPALISVTWTRDGRGLAVAWQSEEQRRLDVIINGRASSYEGSGTVVAWAHSGYRLAISDRALATTVLDAETGAQVLLSGGGSNPRWSPDDRFLSLSNPSNYDQMRVFSTDNGTELLRVSGFPACIGDPWFADGEIAGGGPMISSVSVPEGVVRQRTLADFPDATVRAPAGVQLDFGTDNHIRLLDSGGTVLASVKVAARLIWSYSYDVDGVFAILPDGRGMLRPGVGGKGLCDGASPEPRVEVPPYATPGWFQG